MLTNQLAELIKERSRPGFTRTLEGQSEFRFTSHQIIKRNSAFIRQYIRQRNRMTDVRRGHRILAALMSVLFCGKMPSEGGKSD